MEFSAAEMCKERTEDTVGDETVGMKIISADTECDL